MFNLLRRSSERTSANYYLNENPRNMAINKHHCCCGLYQHLYQQFHVQKKCIKFQMESEGFERKLYTRQGFSLVPALVFNYINYPYDDRVCV